MGASSAGVSPWDSLLAGKFVVVASISGTVAFAYQLSPSNQIRLSSGYVLGTLMRRERKLKSSQRIMESQAWEIFQTWLDAGCPDDRAFLLGTYKP